MAKLMTFMYANEVVNQVSQGGDTQIIRDPLLALKPVFIPGQLSFSIVFGITEIEPTKDHVMQYKLISPEKEIVVDTGDVTIPKNIDSTGEKIDGFVGSLDLRNVVFRIKGLYRSIFIVNGETLKDDTILVTEGQ